MRRVQPVIWVCILLFSVLIGVSAQDEPPVLRVDVAQDLGEISPLIYGANFGYSSIPQDLIEEAVASGVTLLRLGGEITDNSTLTPFNLDITMLAANLLNAEVVVSVRLYDGSIEDAVKLLQYSMDKGYDIQYWSIGNEPNLFHVRFEDYDTPQYNEEWRAMAEALLAVNPDITIVGPDVSQYATTESGTPKDSAGRDWLREFLKANGDLVDIVSVHRYPFPQNNQVTTIDQLRANAQEWDDIVQHLRSVVIEETGEDKPLGIMEFNSHYANSSGGPASLDSFYNAIWAADVLGRLISEKVTLGAYFDFQRGPSGAWGLMQRYDVRPSYYAYVMYTHFGTQLVESSSADEDVTIYAALNDEGALTLMVINLADDEQTRTLQLDNFTAAGDAEVWRFDANHNAELLEPETLGETITVPGQSITVYIVSPA